jgi:hypothetical protein
VRVARDVGAEVVARLEIGRIAITALDEQAARRALPAIRAKLRAA